MLFFFDNSRFLGGGLASSRLLGDRSSCDLAKRLFRQGLPTLVQIRPCQGRTHRRCSLERKIWRRIKAKGPGYIKQTTS